MIMELYNTNEMPLSNDEEKRRIQEKIINGEPITAGEAVKLHTRDHVIKKIGNYEGKEYDLSLINKIWDYKL